MRGIGNAVLKINKADRVSNGEVLKRYFRRNIIVNKYISKRRNNSYILRHGGALEHISVGTVIEITHRGKLRLRYISEIVES